MAMQYVFNPRNRQINPVTGQTFVDPTLRDKVISPQLYALVCKGKVSIEDIAALFAVGKSPEVLVKNAEAVKSSPMAQAPANTATVQEAAPAVAEAGSTGADDETAPATADAAFDGRELCKKTQEELLILAGMAGIDTSAPDFQPTRPNLIKALKAKAQAAEAGAAAPAQAAAVVVVQDPAAV